MMNRLHAGKFESEKGFSLLEVMIALGILAVGILAIISMHISAIDGNAHAVKFTDSLLSAQSRIEYLLMEDFDDIDTSNTYAAETHADNDVIPVGYTLEWKARLFTNVQTNDMMEINVRVKDNEGKIFSNLTICRNRG
jgi:prepilin-type N-terminal cleavage/methylation domain-containing protein